MIDIDNLVGALRNRGRLRIQFEGLDDSQEALERTQEYRGAAEIERLRKERDDLEATAIQAATLAQRLRADLDNLCSVLEEDDMHGGDAHDDGCPICIAIADARAALAKPCVDKPSRVGDGIAAGKLARWRSLGQAILDNDPDDASADAVTCLDVWRKESADLLAMNE